MNIQPFQSSVTPAGPARVGGRLDIRSDAPADAHVASAQNTPATTPQPPAALEGAGLLNVLNLQEQQALAAAFGESKSPVYSGHGTNVGEPSVLGVQLDLQA
jgi:hypothetical protein